MVTPFQRGYWVKRCIAKDSVLYSQLFLIGNQVFPHPIRLAKHATDRRIAVAYKRRGGKTYLKILYGCYWNLTLYNIDVHKRVVKSCNGNLYLIPKEMNFDFLYKEVETWVDPPTEYESIENDFMGVPQGIRRLVLSYIPVEEIEPIVHAKRLYGPHGGHRKQRRKVKVKISS